MTMMPFTVLPLYPFTVLPLKAFLSEPVAQCYECLMAFVGHSGS